MCYSLEHVWDQVFTFDTILNIGETGDICVTVGNSSLSNRDCTHLNIVDRTKKHLKVVCFKYGVWIFIENVLQMFLAKIPFIIH